MTKIGFHQQHQSSMLDTQKAFISLFSGLAGLMVKVVIHNKSPSFLPVETLKKTGLCFVDHSLSLRLSHLLSGWQGCWPADGQGYCFHFPSRKHSFGRKRREGRRVWRWGGGKLCWEDLLLLDSVFIITAAVHRGNLASYIKGSFIDHLYHLRPTQPCTQAFIHSQKETFLIHCAKDVKALEKANSQVKGCCVPVFIT